MRYSRYFVRTLKEDPAEAEVVSHRLMLRAGMIRRVAAGIYDILPLGLRTLRKVEAIVREEMDRAGALEVLMPLVQPAELWEETGRWDKFGPELLRLQDRHDRRFCFSPTAEEVVTDIIRRDVRSYREFPINLYQIHTKFRDEIRPRFGLMRGREFLMKDAYSFDADEEGAEKSYEAMRVAYNRIFRRCGLSFRAVEADSGSIGGAFSSEFMVLADTGEDAVASCRTCSYAANREMAATRPFPSTKKTEGSSPLVKVGTPEKRTIFEVSEFLGASPDKMVKTLIYLADGEPVAVLVRGDHELSEIKLKRTLDADLVEMADAETTRKLTGAPVGFAGPVGLKVRLIADHAVESMPDLIVGANEKDAHYTGCRIGRDFSPPSYADLRLVQTGDPCPRCDGVLRVDRGIEVGHIFKLGTGYSEAMKCLVLNEKGEDVPAIMGCYGIGIGRTAAAAIEQNHDENGIIWPVAIAPFHVCLITLNPKGEVLRWGDEIYKDFLEAGVEVLYDDRDERAGVKFKDADLLGIPFRVTVGAKGLAQEIVELKKRSAPAGEFEKIPPGQIVERVKALIDRALEDS